MSSIPKNVETSLWGRLAWSALACCMAAWSAGAVGSGTPWTLPGSSAQGSVEEPQADRSGAKASLPEPPNRPKPSRAIVNRLIASYSERFGVEHNLVDAVVRAESAYDAHAVSPAGAVGLMQIMPNTGTEYGIDSVDALFDAATNIRIGVRHLKRLVGRYGIGKAVMAYNAGEGALARYNGFVTYPETQRYTHKVLSTYLGKRGIATYSDEARRITGITLTPGMAVAGLSKGGAGRRLRRVDLSTLSLRVRPSLSDRALDPAAHSVGPASKPMFVLERPKKGE
ncbi:MAG: lytic transglycosylase domain-containing protein [Thiohalocapsa sp.]